MIWLKIGLVLLLWFGSSALTFALVQASLYKHMVRIGGAWDSVDSHLAYGLSLTGPFGLVIFSWDAIKEGKPYFMWKRKPIPRREEPNVRYIRIPHFENMSPEEEIESKMEWVKE